MVAREILVDKKLFLVKQCMRGSFDALEFSVNGRSIGSLTVDLAQSLSSALHQASSEGPNGRFRWRHKDLLLWMQITRRSNHQGAFFKVVWAKRTPNSRHTVLFIAEGPHSLGWKRLAIGIDSLNKTTLNKGENLFPCDNFAGRSRAYNVIEFGKRFTRLDALGSSNHHGVWKHGVICTRTSLRLGWELIGNTITTMARLVTPFHLLPINNWKAMFLIDDGESRSALLSLKQVMVMNEVISIDPWFPRLFSTCLPSVSKVFWISLFGVPLHCWTVETFQCLANRCGELLAIDSSTLSLEDISKVKIKIRNNKGILDIPRLITLNTVDGDFEIVVNCIPAGDDLTDSAFKRIRIGVDDEVACDQIISHGVADVANGNGVVTPSYRDVVVGQRGGSNASSLKWVHRQRRSTLSKRPRWAWIPKKNLTPRTVSGSSSSDFCPLPTATLIQNSNLNLALAPTSEGPNVNREGPELNYAGPIACQREPVTQQLDNEGEEVPSTFPQEDVDTSINSLIHKRLAVGIELGLSSNLDDLPKTLALFHRAIIQDERAVALSKENLIESIPEEIVGEEEPQTPMAEFSTETPVVVFQNTETIEWWEDSQLREDFLYDENDFIIIPPGFESANPPPPGFETAKLRRKALRVDIYRKLDTIDGLIMELSGG